MKDQQQELDEVWYQKLREMYSCGNPSIFDGKTSKRLTLEEAAAIDPILDRVLRELGKLPND